MSDQEPRLPNFLSRLTPENLVSLQTAIESAEMLLASRLPKEELKTELKKTAASVNKLFSGNIPSEFAVVTTLLNEPPTNLADSEGTSYVHSLHSALDTARSLLYET